MARNKHVTLDSIIGKYYEQLPTAERKLADIILDFPGELAAYNATELAELAGVSKAAATRFFKRLGFSSFEEARRLARDSKSWGSPLYLQSKHQLNESPGQHIQQYVDEEVKHLQQTLSSLSMEEVGEICQAINCSRRIWVVGFRNSQYIAAYIRWQLIQFRANVMLLPGGAGETLGEYLADVDKDDLFIVIGVRRRISLIRQLMQHLHDKGVPILYLTDPSASRTTQLAKWVIRSPVSTSFLFDSYTSLMSVARFLAIEAYSSSGKKGRARLKAIEAEHEQLAEFE